MGSDERPGPGPARAASTRPPRGVLTVNAELSDCTTGPEGWTRADTTSPVLVALPYAEGIATLVTEDPDGPYPAHTRPGTRLRCAVTVRPRPLAMPVVPGRLPCGYGRFSWACQNPVTTSRAVPGA